MCNKKPIQLLYFTVMDYGNIKISLQKATIELEHDSEATT